MNEKLCDKPGHAIVFWPTGQQVICCQEYAAKAAAVLHAIGYHAVFVPAYPETSCEQKVKP